MGTVVLRLLHPPYSLGHASQADSHGQEWSLPSNELVQCSRERIGKFPYVQKAPVAGFCAGIFVAMLRKQNISLPVVKSAKLLAHSPAAPFSFFAERSFFVLQGAVCFMWSLYIPEIQKHFFFVLKYR